MAGTEAWAPPGKDCGACGARTCDDFVVLVEDGTRTAAECCFFQAGGTKPAPVSSYSGTDVAGKEYDFVLLPLPNEPSARKFVVPFRADLVERWGIGPGDIVTGRPAGPGCPVYHALRVLAANPVTGVLACHTVGPAYSRDREVHDVQAYHVHAFEGLARTIRAPPTLGLRQRFLPGLCMLDLGHTALVNMVLHKEFGTHVRLEDIRIL